MRISTLKIQNFRNIEFASLQFDLNCQYLLGDNGEGKTNLLEAIGLLTALRSFRTRQTRYLIRSNCHEAQMVCGLEHESLGNTEVSIKLKNGLKDVSVDGEKIIRFAHYIGKFPSVVMSSQDIQLLRGSPQLRRRFLNLTFAATDRIYFDALRDYHRALQERNRLLKRRVSKGELAAFESILAPAANLLMKKRQEGISALSKVLAEKYEGISDAKEITRLQYEPDINFGENEDYMKLLIEMRERDYAQQTTTRGPHRDDFKFILNDYDANNYGSDGQQRALVLALRLAEATWHYEQTKIKPVILCDDILNELDDRRRSKFWDLINPGSQVIANGTLSPPGDGQIIWSLFRVDKGQIKASENDGL